MVKVTRLCVRERKGLLLHAQYYIEQMNHNSQRTRWKKVDDLPRKRINQKNVQIYFKTCSIRLFYLFRSSTFNRPDLLVASFWPWFALLLNFNNFITLLPHLDLWRINLEIFSLIVYVLLDWLYWNFPVNVSEDFSFDPSYVSPLKFEKLLLVISFINLCFWFCLLRFPM